MTLTQLLANVLKLSPDIRVLERSDYDGLSVITVCVPILGHETVIQDAAGVHLVAKYDSEETARAGHNRLMSQLLNGLTDVERLATETTPAAKVRLLRASAFGGAADIPPDHVEIRALPFVNMAAEVRVSGEVVAKGTEEYCFGYLKMLKPRIIGLKAPEPTPIEAGAMHERLPDGSYRKVVADGREPDIVVCRRVVDFPKGHTPEGFEVDTCTRCSALVAYDPKKNKYPDRPLCCMPCAGVRTAVTH